MKLLSMVEVRKPQSARRWWWWTYGRSEREWTNRITDALTKLGIV